MYVRKYSRQVLVVLFTAAFVLSACNVGAAPTSPTLDVNAINTAIVGTTVAQFSAQFTQTALAVPPATNTPLPTDTPVTLPTFSIATENNSAAPTVSFDATPTALFGATPVFTQVSLPTTAPTQALGDSCLNAVFEEDITYPDGTVVKAGETITKIFKIRNTGTCGWDEGFTLVFIGGSANIGAYNYEFQSKDAVAGGEAINIAVGVTLSCTQGNQEASWRLRSDAGYYFGGIYSLYVVAQGKTGGCS